MFAEELLILHRGQGRELIWRDNTRCPTEDEYLAMVKDSEYLVLVVSTLGLDCGNRDRWAPAYCHPTYDGVCNYECKRVSLSGFISYSC